MATTARAFEMPDTPYGFVTELLDRSRGADLRKTDRTRLKLLASLASELEAGGERAGLKVARVTAGAGVAHGTYYRYFDDVSAGMEALIDTFSGYVRESLEDAGAGTPGSRERICDIVRVQVGLFRDNPALMGCQLDPREAAAGETVRSRMWEWLMRMAAMIAKGRSERSGSTRQPPAELLPVAYALNGMVEAFLGQVYLRKEPEFEAFADDEEALAEFLADLWCRGAYDEGV